MNTHHTPDRRERPPVYASRYASTSTDRRESYYERSAPLIAADPLDFYCRAERGRKWLTEYSNAADMAAKESQQ